MTPRLQSAELSDEDAAILAAEIARLATLFGSDLSNQEPTSSSRPKLREEIRKGPLSKFLAEDDDSTGQLALRRAKAELAAHDARAARRRPLQAPSRPPWLISVLTALVVPLILAIAAHFFASYQQLKLFREEARRRQADVLLGQLASVVTEATHLKDWVIREETYGLSPLQADLSREKAIELEQSFNAAVQLHNFEAFPDLNKADERAASEIRALQDCLQAAAGRPVKAEWRTKWKIPPDVDEAATSASPCGKNFSVEALSDFTTAVNQTIDARIGGALFPRKSQK